MATDDNRHEPEAAVAPATETGAATAQRVLVVSEDARVVDVAACQAMGLEVRLAAGPAEAIPLARAWLPQLALVDAELPESSSLVQGLRAAHPCTCVLLVAVPSGEALTQAMTADADSVLVRPPDVVSLRRVISQEARHTAQRNNSGGTPLLSQVFIGSSRPMRDVWRLTMLASQTDSSAVITGETGSGKEVVARALHRLSARRNGPFVAVNCAAIPENLLESELFGHEKGAFTGAAAQRKGRFELADGGTLFLDEIGDLPLGLQVKLLRVLQERSFERVGGSQTVSVDVRVVAATHADVEGEVRKGRFRSDLYYRLHVLSIHVPPLRDRKADLAALWNHFVDDAAAQDGRPAPHTSPAALRLLMRHHWPGNIRELCNVAQHALTVATRDTITPTHLPAYLREEPAQAGVGANLVGLTMHEVERAAILETYEALGTVKAAADMLTISPRKIQYRLREYRAQGWLPEREQPADGAGGASDLAHPTQPVRVLLGEDDDELRWVLADFLKSEGYQVIALPDGKAVFEHLRASMLPEGDTVAPDLIVTDVRMPGLTGMQLLESVRARQWAIPVVLISAFGDQDIRARATALGAAALLDKPIEITALRDVLRRATVS